MAVSSPRRGHRSRRAQRTPEPAPLRAHAACAVGGCGAPARTACGRCQRLVCARHGGAQAPLGAGTPEFRASSDPRPLSRTYMRCALCRLDDRRGNQATVRRIWWGISILGFALIEGAALRNNPAQGIALLALALVVVCLAVVYDRRMRRR